MLRNFLQVSRGFGTRALLPNQTTSVLQPQRNLFQLNTNKRILINTHNSILLTPVSTRFFSAANGKNKGSKKAKTAASKGAPKRKRLEEIDEGLDEAAITKFNPAKFKNPYSIKILTMLMKRKARTERYKRYIARGQGKVTEREKQTKQYLRVAKAIAAWRDKIKSLQPDYDAMLNRMYDPDVVQMLKTTPLGSALFGLPKQSSIAEKGKH